MRSRALLSAILLVCLAGCSKPAPSPPAPVTSTDVPLTAAQQARTAQSEAQRLYQHKSFAQARTQALVAMGLLKLDGSDPKGVRTMRLLAAKAGAKAKDPAALGELQSLARDKALDAEGKQLAVALERSQPHKSAPAGPVNPPPEAQGQAGAPADSGTSSDAAAAQNAHQVILNHRSWQGQ